MGKAKKSGYVRVRVDGNMYELTEEIILDKNLKHNIEIIVDRLIVKQGIEKRLTDSVESVLHLSEGLLSVDVIGGEMLNFSQSFSCPDCGISIEEIEPRSFSFNNPFGACPTCYGLGYKMEFSEDLMIPDPSLSINEGAIAVLGCSLVQTNQVLLMRYFRRCAESINLIWTHRLKNIRRRFMILFFMAQTGKR